MISQRYSGIVTNFNSYTYHMLGCGAIGSSTATQLVRMGATDLKLYDMDTVSLENIGVSMYNQWHINEHKTDALKLICQEIGGKNISVECITGEFLQYKPTGKDIVILGFDSMQSRLNAVEKILLYKQPDYLIDGRMGAEHFQQYTFPKPTLNQYKKTWYSDLEGDSEPCNAKATSYCSNMSGSWICSTIKKILTKQPYHKEIVFNFLVPYLENKGLVKV